MSKKWLLTSIFLFSCCAVGTSQNSAQLFLPVSSVQAASASDEIASASSGNSHFYTDEELCQMALEDYKSKYGSDDELIDDGWNDDEAVGNEITDGELTAASADNGDGTVTIQIYQNLGGHNSTAAWYQIDRITGEGINVSSGEPIDLTNGSPDVDITFSENESTVLPDEHYECIVDTSEYTSQLLLSPKVPVTDFRVVLLEYAEDADSAENVASIKYEESADAPMSFRIIEELFCFDILTSETPLVVHAELSETIPNIGIVYADRSGEEKLYTFSISGLDGDPLLTEGTIYAD